MKKNNKEIEKYRLTEGPMGSDKSYGNNGCFTVDSGLTLNGRSMPFSVIASDEMGWDHVSVSLPHRTPTWEEMVKIRDLFFADDEWVIEYHPAKSNYVNMHPYCLHLWRPQEAEIPVPPGIMV